MGRRKSKRKPPPKKKMTGDLETQFTCPFCNHEKSCDVKMYVHLSDKRTVPVKFQVFKKVTVLTLSRLQGKRQKHRDNIVFRLLGGVPDPYYLYPFLYMHVHLTNTNFETSF